MQTTEQYNYKNGHLPVRSPDAYVPAHSTEAEQSTLGAMLIEPEAIDTASKIVIASDFYRESHTRLFVCITELHRSGQPVDPITVSQWLTDNGGIEALTMPYLLSLFDTVPTAANVEHYANIVRKKSRLRQLYSEAVLLAAKTNAPDADAEYLLTQVIERLQGANEQSGKPGTPKFLPISQRLIDAADVRDTEPVQRLFGDILIEGATHWLSAVPGLGKSTIAQSVLAAAAEGASILWGQPIPKPFKSVYVDLENSFFRAEKQRRIYLGTEPSRNRLFFLDAIDLPRELDAFIQECQERDISLVVLDTASRVFAKLISDENDNAQASRHIIPILDKLKAAGLATLVIGHSGKSGHGQRGASAIEAAVDVTLSLELYQGELDSPDAVVALKTRKNRMLGWPKPLLLKRIGNDHFELVSAEDAGVSQSDAKETPSARVRCATDVLAFLTARDGEPARFTEIVQAQVAVGHSQGTAKRVVTELQKEGTIAHNLTGYVLAQYFPED